MDINDRWCQQRGDDLFVVDIYDNLYSIKWSDIEQDIYDEVTLVSHNVEDFYAAKHGVGVITTDMHLILPGRTPISLAICLGTHNQKSNEVRDSHSKSDWSILVHSGGHWIAGGNLHGNEMLASFGRGSRPVSILSISSSYRTKLHNIINCFERRNRSVIMAQEREGCCHLISKCSRGRLTLLQSIASLVDDTVDYPDLNHKIKSTIWCTENEGEMLIAGYMWMKRLCLKLK